MDFQWNTWYEIPNGRTPAKFVNELVNGRLAPVTIRLETRDGETVEARLKRSPPMWSRSRSMQPVKSCVLCPVSRSTPSLSSMSKVHWTAATSSGPNKF